MDSNKDTRLGCIVISLGAIVFWGSMILLVLFLSSCSLMDALAGMPNRSYQTVEPVGETIAIDPKRNIAYVMFPCVEAPRERIPCGMILQINLDMYGETYLGEKRNIESPKQTFKQIKQ